MVNLFYFEISTVESQSMSPNINKYDLVFITKTDTNKLKDNDIVVFFDNSGKHKIIHRIIKTTTGNDNTKQFITQGDNNPRPDNLVHSEDDIYAKFGFRIPYVGLLINYLTSFLGVLNILVWILIIIFIELIWKDSTDTKTTQYNNTIINTNNKHKIKLTNNKKQLLLSLQNTVQQQTHD